MFDVISFPSRGVHPEGIQDISRGSLRSSAPPELDSSNSDPERVEDSSTLSGSVTWEIIASGGVAALNHRLMS
jgi:hypothetical protein